jgi:hypothetical protein
MLASIRFAGSLVLMLGVVLWLSGCSGKPATTDQASSGGQAGGKSQSEGHDGHDHDHDGDGHDDHDDHDGHDHDGHDHGHDHVHGPHDGELIELAGAAPGEGGHAEWTHDNASGRVTFYILDDEQKEELPIDAPSITLEVTVKDKEPSTYTLEAVAPDAEGKSAKFEIEDPELLTALKLKDAVDAQLQVTIDGKNLTGKVEYIDHGH